MPQPPPLLEPAVPQLLPDTTAPPAGRSKVTPPSLLDPAAPQLLPGTTAPPAGRSKPTPPSLLDPAVPQLLPSTTDPPLGCSKPTLPPLLDPAVPQLLPGSTGPLAGRSKPTPTELVPPRRVLLADGEDEDAGEDGSGSQGDSEDDAGDDPGQRVYFNSLFGQWLPFPTEVPDEEEQTVPGLSTRIRHKMAWLAGQLRRPCASSGRKKRPPIRKHQIGQPTEPRRPVYEPIVL